MSADGRLTEKERLEVVSKLVLSGSNASTWEALCDAAHAKALEWAVRQCDAIEKGERVNGVKWHNSAGSAGAAIREGAKL